MAPQSATLSRTYSALAHQLYLFEAALATRDRRLARNVPVESTLVEELYARLQRDAWIYERDEIADLTMASHGDSSGDVLVVRAHIRRGTEPVVTSALADLQLYNLRDSHRGSSKDHVFLAALRLVSELVHIIRPSDWADGDGDLMRNQSVFEFGDTDFKGVRTSWHRGEFLSIEKSPDRTSVLWSSDLSLAALIARLRATREVQATTVLDYELVPLSAQPSEERVGTWSELQKLVDSGDAESIGSVTIPLGEIELWWGLPNRAEHERYPMIALTFASRVADEVVAEYVEGTGTADVRAKGRQALAAFRS